MKYVIMNKDKNRVVVYTEYMSVMLSGRLDCLDRMGLLSLKEKPYTSKIRAYLVTFIYSSLCVVSYSEYMERWYQAISSK
jgi:hypothetical protein